MGTFDFNTRWPDVRPSGFYVYIHRRMGSGEPFYVGKGSGNRGWSGRQRNAHWQRIATKNGVSVEIVSDGMTECCAYTLEKIVVMAIGCENLCNRTTGGQNPKNIVSELVDSERRALRSKPLVNNVGMIFDSQVEAAEWLRENGWPKAASGPISKCVSGGSSKAYGYIWWHLDSMPDRPKSPRDTACKRVKKLVECSNGMRFHGYRDAVSWLVSMGNLKASKSMLSYCCRGRSKTAYGYKWRFVA